MNLEFGLKFRLVIYILIIQLVLTSIAFSTTCKNGETKTPETFNRLCKNVDDIICKNVPDRIRRSCDEKDKTIVHADMSPHEVYDFAKGCMTSAATSFVHFFTEFLPELCKEIWKLTKEGYELVTSKEDQKGLWKSIKGAFESARSLTSDVYESIKKDPGKYFAELWNKITDAVGPLVADYDCLNPQAKVEKICGFVAEWVTPPALLAKVIVKGYKGAKELLEVRKSTKAAEKAAKAPQELAARLKLDTNNLKKQALQLQELRAIDKKGHLKDPKKKLMLEALELRSPELSLLNKQLDDQVMRLRTEFEETATTPERKAKILEDIFESDHPSRSEMIDLALKDNSIEVREAARLQAIRLRKTMDYTNPIILEDIEKSAQKLLSMKNKKSDIIIAELKLLPDSAYLEVMSKLTGEARTQALSWIGGRSSHVLSELMKKANDEEKLLILGVGTGRDFSKEKANLALEYLFTDPNKKVQELCHNIIQSRNNADMLELTKNFQKSTDPKIKTAADNLARELQAEILKDPKAVKNISAEETIKNFIHNPTPDLSTLTGRDAEVIKQALKHPSPEIRNSIYFSLSRRADLALADLAPLILKEPVDYTREQGARFLGSLGNSTSRNALHNLIDNDLSAEVRNLAGNKINNFGKLTLKDNEAERVLYERKLWLKTLTPEQKQIEAHIQNFEAANNVYSLPEFESKIASKSLVEQKKDFLEGVPQYLKVKETVTDTKSGFKLVQYSDEINSGHSIFSIAGTQTTLDVLTDANIGIPQIKSIAYQDSVKKIVAEMIQIPQKTISVTGHSLGGGVAQAFAHDVAAELKKAGVKDWDKRIEVTTWNGFGGITPLKQMNKLDKDVAAGLKATNYYVEGDVVSRIGQHFGEIKNLPRATDIDKGAISSHLRETIEAGIHQGGVANQAAENRVKIIVATSLVSRSLGYMASMYQDARFALNRKDILNRMLEARQLWAEEYGYRDLKSTPWLAKELEDIKKNAGINAKWVNKAIEEADKKLEQTLKEKRSAPLP